MKTQIFYFLLTINFFCQGCQSNGKTADSNSGKEKEIERQREMLLGHWRFIDDEFVSMVIKKDSIYYPDELQHCLYKITNQLLIVRNGKSLDDTFKYQMRGTDTLDLNIGDISQTYIRQDLITK